MTRTKRRRPGQGNDQRATRGVRQIDGDDRSLQRQTKEASGDQARHRRVCNYGQRRTAKAGRISSPMRPKDDDIGADPVGEKVDRVRWFAGDDVGGRFVDREARSP